jgi:hypothetical protein
MQQIDSRLTSPVIFVGPGRSGSTIISEIILAHESLAWPSNHQEYFPRTALINLMRPLFDNRFWRVIGEKDQRVNKTRFFNSLLPLPAEAFPFWESLTRPGIDFSRGFLLGEVADKAEKRRIRKAVARIVAWQGKQRFSMKITGPGRIGYLQSIFPDARFVNVVRDPVATVRSLLAVPFWKDLGMHRLWWTGAYSEDEIARFESVKSDPIAATAFQVNKVLQTTLMEAQKCDANLLTVRYEDFVADPTATIEDICSFLDLSVSVTLREKLRQTAVHDRNQRKPKPEETSEQAILEVIGDLGS